MIARLPNDPLNKIARRNLTASKLSEKSWFTQIRDICLQYNLPHPLHLLDSSLSKQKFKNLIKPKVYSYWQTILSKEAELLPSLSYFRTNLVSVTKPHLILSSAGSNPYEVSKSRVQCVMLSGRYKSENLRRHWSTNKEGYCLAPSCHKIVETLDHILLSCPSYFNRRQLLINLWAGTRNLNMMYLLAVFQQSNIDNQMQFLLDPTAIPEVTYAVSLEGPELIQQLLYIFRTWCFSVHRDRFKLFSALIFYN